MTKSLKLVALALVTALTVTACSSGGDKETSTGETNTAESTVTLTEAQEAKKDLADVAPGEAVVPGSIESTQVQGLSSECERAISPARDLAKEYTSGLLVPADDQTINNVLSGARSACSDQEFASWYYDEFVGWQNAKP
jgi:ABC-type enterochelin transport system substrate-binding protein